MATFAEIYAIASNPDFQSRVRTAAVKAAIAILGEAQTGEVNGVPYSYTLVQTTKRQAMASSVIQGGQNWFNWALTLTMSNATIQTNGTASTDAELDFVMPSIWDDMSGVTKQDLEVV